MYRYTIVKILTLFLGVLSVVARSLPERRSEINVRSHGVHGLINPPTEVDSANGNDHQDVGDPKQRLEGLGLVMRDAPLDIQGGRCGTICDDGIPGRPNSDDCKSLYERLQANPGTFDVGVGASEAKPYKQGNCAAVVVVNNSVDNSGQAITYDWGEFAAVVQWLNDECIIRRGATFGACVFGVSWEKSPYIGVSIPSRFGLG